MTTDKGKGWHRESARHSLARKGIKTMKLSQMTFGQARAKGYSKNIWENAKEHSRFMEKNNPMLNLETRNKARKTHTGVKRPLHSKDMKRFYASLKGKERREEQSKNMKKYVNENPDFFILNPTKESIAKTLSHPNYKKAVEELKKRDLTKEYQKMCAIAQNRTPTKPEKELNKILQKNFPKEWKYVGGGKNPEYVGHKCPDFINVNGEGKIIELYGDYWHSKKMTGRPKKQEEKNKINYFKKKGYSTLIIWEHELKNKNKLETKINQFTKLRSPKALQSEELSGEGCDVKSR